MIDRFGLGIMSELSNRLGITSLGEYYNDLLVIDSWISRNTIGIQGKTLLIEKLKERESEITQQLGYLASKRGISMEQMKEEILLDKARQLTPNAISLRTAVFCNSALVEWNLALYEALGKMIGSDRPMGLVTPDGYQIWVNQQAADLFKDPPEVSVTIKSSDYWALEDLAELHKKIEKYGWGSEFEHTYRCQLTSDGQWARVTACYEILEGGYRLATILSHEFIDKPDGVENSISSK